MMVIIFKIIWSIWITGNWASGPKHTHTNDYYDY